MPLGRGRVEFLCDAKNSLLPHLESTCRPLCILSWEASLRMALGPLKQPFLAQAVQLSILVERSHLRRRGYRIVNCSRQRTDLIFRESRAYGWFTRPKFAVHKKLTKRREHVHDGFNVVRKLLHSRVDRRFVSISAYLIQNPLDLFNNGLSRRNNVGDGSRDYV